MNIKSRYNSRGVLHLVSGLMLLICSLLLVAESEESQPILPPVIEKKIPLIPVEDRPEAKHIALDKPIEATLVSQPKKSAVVLAKPASLKAVVETETLTDVIEAKGSEVNTRVVTEDPAIDEWSPSEKLNPYILLGIEIPPATATRLAWSPDQSFKGIAVPTPVLVVNGQEPGPVVCLTAAIHGDELNGIEIVRRVLYKLDPEELTGTVIGVPIVNLQGFHRSSRYLTDRRDLNRYFPGNPYGSSASRLAYSFFNEVILQCDVLVDLHTGSFHRTNLPQLRANIHNPQVLALAKNFGATVIVHGEGAVGTLRRAAVDAGVPAVTLEAGESMRLQEEAVAHGVKGIETLLEHMSMLSSLNFWNATEAIYDQTQWMRADQGGILFSRVKLGQKVNIGDVLGVVTDPITNVSNEIIALYDGRVIGMGLNQVVMPGFATFHIGIDSTSLESGLRANGLTEKALEEALLDGPFLPEEAATKMIEEIEINDTEDFN